MNMLYAPWRSEYTSDTNEGKNTDNSQDTCVFCKQFAENNDQKYGIIKRFKHVVLVLNKYPYNAGHVLILPINHVDSISKLSNEARTELINLMAIGTEIIQKTLKSDGINVGINLGKFAGAGIPAHLHVHLLPRWQGDTNFMPTIAETKVISFDLTTIYQKLHTAFENITL
jgi:ATP adenylyltransferase